MGGNGSRPLATEVLSSIVQLGRAELLAIRRKGAAASGTGGGRRLRNGEMPDLIVGGGGCSSVAVLGF